MLNKKSGVVVGCWLAIGSLHAEQPLTPEQLFERLAPSVWTVEVFDRAGKRLGLGSSVVIGEKLMITNCHVVDKAEVVRVRNEQQRLAAYRGISDPAHDLCQLAVPELAAPVVQVADSRTLRVGTKLYGLGSPRGLELTLSDGLLSGMRRTRSGELEALQTTVPISPGSSGGGLFNVYGQLVGVTTWMLKESQNLNFAVPAHMIANVALHAVPKPTVVAAAPAPAPAVTPTVVAPPIAAAPVVPRAPVAAPVAPADGIAAPASPPPAASSNVIAAAPVARAPVPTPAPRSSADGLQLAVGSTFSYRLLDRLTGIERRVDYRVDRIEQDRVVFNQGDRVERHGGEVLDVGGAIGGEADAAAPPGGWVPGHAKVGQEWKIAYASGSRGQAIKMDLQARVAAEEVLALGGKNVPTLRVEFKGYTDRAITIPANASGRYRATVWYAPSLRRMVKFEVYSRGGLMSSTFVVSEVLELVGWK